MGNCLSPFLSNLFMTYFEKQCKNTFDYFPRIWLRYVDDIFAIFDTSKSNTFEFLQKINSQYETIKFTCEEEVNGTLPFLDLTITRTANKLKYNIFRKPTHTDMYIPQDSSHHISQKLAPFHSMINRLLKVPLSKNDFNKELTHIKKIAGQNGYDASIVTNILRKQTQTEYTTTHNLNILSRQKTQIHKITLCPRNLQQIKTNFFQIRLNSGLR
jgi:hypothetical protein